MVCFGKTADYDCVLIGRCVVEVFLPGDDLTSLKNLNIRNHQGLLKSQRIRNISVSVKPVTGVMSHQPQWVLIFDSGAGSAADRWSLCVN